MQLRIGLLVNVAAGQEEGLLAELLLNDIPHKLDQNFWNNREQLEELISLCDGKNWPSAVSPVPSLAR